MKPSQNRLAFILWLELPTVSSLRGTYIARICHNVK
jgi:hypothetical protein